tara:strand:+ start:17752 stop:18396 length:645 start_codon:yes stop_codon:yes gene_type:complete
MKIIFVDAENVGFKGLEAIKASILDKVFVFSRIESIKLFSQKKLFLCLTEYPEGANQADFYIVAYLSRLLTSVTKAEIQAIDFILYSDDINLINAFKFQCNLCGAKHDIVSFNQKNKQANSEANIEHINKNESVPKLPVNTHQAKTKKQANPTSHCQKIFNLLNKPTSLSQIEKTLKLSKPVFTQAVNKLVKDKKICRVSKNGKQWIQNPHDKK